MSPSRAADQTTIALPPQPGSIKRAVDSKGRIKIGPKDDDAQARSTVADRANMLMMMLVDTGAAEVDGELAVLLS